MFMGLDAHETFFRSTDIMSEAEYKGVPWRIEKLIARRLPRNCHSLRDESIMKISILEQTVVSCCWACKNFLWEFPKPDENYHFKWFQTITQPKQPAIKFAKASSVAKLRWAPGTNLSSDDVWWSNWSFIETFCQQLLVLSWQTRLMFTLRMSLFVIKLNR